MYLQVGENVDLICDYELAGEEIYSVKWYKDGQEIFRCVSKSINMFGFEASGLFLLHQEIKELQSCIRLSLWLCFD